MMPDFLLELRSEEIPARMQAGARASLEKLFGEQMATAGVTYGAVTVWSTPRRLALIARDLPEATAAVSEEVKGPRTSAPAQAIEGFLRKTGLAQDQLVDRGGVWFAVTHKPGRATVDVLAEAIPAIVRAFPWPKSMRWGAASLSSEALRWVRPLSGIVAILGEELVACEVGGIASGYATRGHRFHHPDPITIGGAHDYVDKLRLSHVIVDHVEREALVRDGARTAAAGAGLTLIEDEGLVVENAGLTEWPVPLLGRFDPEFLAMPPEVIQLTARTNQKYFTCRDASGALADAFVCTANIAARDAGAGIVAGNRKVLAARLSDARFFWEQDRRKTLAQHAQGLARITFHEKLGTVADKVERVAKLARWLVEEGIVGSSSPSSLGEDQERARLADMAEQAARLCKADLVTEMVGEFPELQGLMGGYYARAEGLEPQVADAIRDHYKPVGQGDDVPTAPVTVAVALADKLDTLAGFFAINERPSGSRDPFALRRAAISVIAIVEHNVSRLSLVYILTTAKIAIVEQILKTADQLNDDFDLELDEKRKEMIADRLVAAVELIDTVRNVMQKGGNSWINELTTFFADRLKVQQRDAGVRHDLIDAVFALGNEDDLVRLLARVHALQAFVGTPDGANLLAGYKRAANILRKEGYEAPSSAEEGVGGGGSPPDAAPGASHHPQPPPLQRRGLEELSYTPEPAEQALIEALDAAAPRAAQGVAAEDFAGAMAALASLRAPIDAFFDVVTVNDADPAKRAARLALLDRFRAAVHNVADFSKIEG